MADINALIAQGPDLEKVNPVRNAMIGQQAAMEQAMGDRKIREYDRQAARQPKQEAMADQEQRMAFAKEALPMIYDDQSNTALRNKAMELFGPDAGDTWPETYTGNEGVFQDIMTRLGVTGAGAQKGPKYGALVEAVDRQGNPVFIRQESGGEIAPVEGFTPQIKLSSAMQKSLDEAQSSYMEAIRKSESAQTLVEMIDENLEAWTAGKAGTWKEGLKNVSGQRDIVSQLRTQARGLINSDAIQNLPPGVASDKDIEIAMKGFPPDDAPPSEIRSYVAGLQKMEALRAEFNEFKSEYISSSRTGDTRGLLQAWKQRKAGGSGANQPAPQRKVVRRGNLNGRPIVQYEDGTTEYAD